MKSRVQTIALFIALAAVGQDAAGQVRDTLSSRDWHRPSAEISKILRAPINLDAVRASSTTVSEALESVSNNHSLPILLNSNAFKKEGIADVSKALISKKQMDRMTNVSVAEVLQVIVAAIPGRSRATFVVSQDWIEITTRRRVLQEYLPDFLAHCSESAGKLLCRRLSCEDIADLMCEGLSIKQSLLNNVINLRDK